MTSRLHIGVDYQTHRKELVKVINWLTKSDIPPLYIYPSLSRIDGPQQSERKRYGEVVAMMARDGWKQNEENVSISTMLLQGQQAVFPSPLLSVLSEARAHISIPLPSDGPLSVLPLCRLILEQSILTSKATWMLILGTSVEAQHHHCQSDP